MPFYKRTKEKTITTTTLTTCIPFGRGPSELFLWCPSESFLWCPLECLAGVFLMVPLRIIFMVPRRWCPVILRTVFYSEFDPEATGHHLPGTTWGTLRGTTWGILRGTTWGTTRGTTWGTTRGTKRWTVIQWRPIHFQKVSFPQKMEKTKSPEWTARRW